MSNINTKIRQRISSDKLSVQTKLPSNSEGRDGDLRLTTVKGVNILFGKISGKWYNFGHGKTIGYRNKAALKEKVTDDHIRQLNLDADLYMKKAKFSVADSKYLTIDSGTFDVASSNTVSKIYIGDISLQPTWGTTGSTIKLENAEGHGSDLKILGAGSTGENKDGGDTILSSGLKTGSGDSGSITLGAGDSGTSAATALNVNATSTVLSGTLTINNIDTDTAGDNYLVEVSGVVKKRTPAEVLSDIGAQAAGSYITGSGSLSAQDLTDIGNLSGTNTGDQIIPNNYLRDNEDDTTSGTITAAGFTTTGTWTFDDATSGTVGITTVHTGSSFTDNDTSLMTAGAIKEKIEDYGYVTATLTDEQVQDKVGAMFSSNTETLISATYQDADGTIDLVVDNDLSNYDNSSSGFITATLTTEQVQDIVGNMFSGNTETRISATYEDGDGTIDLVVDDMTADTNTNQLTTFDVDADSGTAETIAHGNTLTLTGGTGISTTVSSTDTVTFALSSGAALSNLGGGSGTTFLKKDGTWATPTDTNTQNTTTLSFVDSSDDIILRNTTGGAGSGTDDIKFVAGSNITLTHTDADNITIASTDTNTTYSVMSSGNSYAAGLVAAGNATHGNEFLRKDGTWVVPTDTDTNTNQLTTFTVSATTDSNATTISQGDDLMFAAGTGITCETTADGTVTISSTVTDTNTTYSAGSLLDLSTTTFNVDLTELTDGTADVVGSADELVYLDDGVQKRKQIDEIKLGQFNNAVSYTHLTLPTKA